MPRGEILYAIYRDGVHKGNIRAKNTRLARLLYARDGLMSDDWLLIVEWSKRYKARKALKGFHYI